MNFLNGHSVFPTVTRANATAIATGTYPSRNGIFGNTLSPGFAAFDTGNFNLIAGTPTPFI